MRKAHGGVICQYLNNTEMYAVLMKDDCTLRVVGTGSNAPVTIYQGWNWIGYQGRQIASLGDALASMQKSDGDILKAQRGVAYWDVNSWSGSLLMMEPGMGYQLKSNADNEFSYPARAKKTGSEMFHPVDFRLYPDNAIMAAKLKDDGMTLANVEIAVFAGNECRTTAVTNEEGIAYLTIPGDEACELTFKVAIAGEVVDAPFTLTYDTDAIYGTPRHPMVIDLGSGTDIREIVNGNGDDIYDLSGRKIANDNATNRKLNKGVYIINGQKKTVK